MGPRGKRMGSGKGSTMRNFNVFTDGSPNIVRVNKSRRLRWARHEPEWRKVGVILKFEQVNLQKRDL